MADALAVAGLVLVLQDVDLGSTLVANDLSGDLDLGQRLCVRGDLVTVDEQHRSELNSGALLRLETVDDDDVAFGHLLLAAARLHNRVPPAIESFTTCGFPAAAMHGAGRPWRLRTDVQIYAAQPVRSN